MKVRVLLILMGCMSSLFAGPPNIILILTDDQGWNNTQVPMIADRPDTRSDFYLTPNLQRLADAGMTFSQAYAPHPVCSPSRHAIQFGMSPAKLKKTTNQGAHYPEHILSPSIP
ncbi:MAG: sulfatase-like hydrolase/transferase, partial [Cyanothece sp. SIO1E1]|nr:sulfatase-like hydrolase/transferase [Cyanothece sp. SIO1E1]